MSLPDPSGKLRGQYIHLARQFDIQLAQPIYVMGCENNIYAIVNIEPFRVVFTIA